MISKDLVESALDKTRQELLDDWYEDCYDAYHRKEFGIGAREATSAKPEISKLFLNWLNQFEMHKRVCIDWRYCEQKHKLREPAQIAAALADMLSDAAGMRPVGACSVAVLILQYGFDRLCNCPE